MNSPCPGDQCCAKFTLKTPHFFKIILDDSDIKKLRIPKEFVKNYGSKVSSSVLLKVPNGAQWKVELQKCADGTWLHNGWSEFAKHYSLSHGSFLVFGYEGNCNFHVIIFDKSATEISYPCSGTHGSSVPNGEAFQDHAMEDNNDDISVEIIDNIPPSKKTRARSPSPSSQPRKKINSKSNPSTRVKDSAIKSNVVKSKIPEADSNVDSAKKRGKRPQKMEICIRKGTLLNEERDVALQRASSFTSKYPFFRVVMQPSYVNGKSLTVPTEFFREHLLNNSGDAILSICHGKTSSFVFTCNPNPAFHRGWKKFVKENNLEIGDVCVFELINQTKITFNVEIFRHAQDAETDPILALEGSKQGFTSFKSEYPFFLSTNRQSNIRRVNVPCSFIKEHIEKDKVNLTVENGGKLWPVKVLLYDRDAYLGGGWRVFASENSLKVGDVCAFELINKEDAVMKVHIFSETAAK